MLNQLLAFILFILTILLSCQFRFETVVVERPILVRFEEVD